MFKSGVLNLVDQVVKNKLRDIKRKQNQAINDKILLAPKDMLGDLQ